MEKRRKAFVLAEPMVEVTAFIKNAQVTPRKTTLKPENPIPDIPYYLT